jgi:hypothetical protein
VETTGLALLELQDDKDSAEFMVIGSKKNAAKDIKQSLRKLRA